MAGEGRKGIGEREKRVEARMGDKLFCTLANPVNRGGEGLGGAYLF